MATTPAPKKDAPADAALPPRKMGCQIALLSFLALIALAALLGYWAWKSEPSYWKKNQQLRQRDYASLLEDASRIEAKVVDESSRAGPAENPLANIGQEREIFISLEEINSWLAAKADAWLVNQNIRIPPQVKDPMVAIDGDELILAFRYDAPEVNQVISAAVGVNKNEDGTLVLTPDGKANLQLSDVRGGRMPLPVEWVVSLLKKNNTGEDKAEQIEKIAKLLDGVRFRPAWPIDRMRQVRLTGYELKEDGIELRVKTEMLEGK